MKTKYIALTALQVIFSCLKSQTVVKMQIPQQADDALSVVTLFSEPLEVNTPVVLGAIGYDITGGLQPYTLTWLKNDQAIGTGNIVVFTPAAGSTYSLKVTDKNNCSSTVSINVTNTGKVKKENVISGDIAVVPTIVTNQQITVAFSEQQAGTTTVRIFDASGNQHLIKELKTSSNLPLALKAGNYFVVVERGTQYFVQKIIVK